MSIYVTGDVHGYPIRLVDENLNLSGYILTEKDKLIICEDFGLPWYGDEEEAKCIAWLGQKPFEILFVDGNHENFDLISLSDIRVLFKHYAILSQRSPFICFCQNLSNEIFLFLSEKIKIR